MKTNHFTSLERATRFLPCFFLTFIYFWATPALVFAQVKKADAQTPVPIVSNEVYQAIAQFYEYDRNIPLDARIVWKQDYQGSSNEKIVFTGVNYRQVPSFLIIPKDGKEKHPIVLIVDGYSGTKERWLQDDSWPMGGLVTKALLKNGFAVMICDAVYHGERNYETGFAGQPWFYEYPYTSGQMIIQTAIEYRRAMDYLATRADIDNTRIGMMGLSMGGMITFQLASIDSRIKTGVAGLTAIFKEAEFQSSTPSTFASRVKSNSFLMFMGNTDPFYSVKEARQLYDMIPLQKKEFVEYPTGHTLTIGYVGLVNDWFLKNLKP